MQYAVSLQLVSYEGMHAICRNTTTTAAGSSPKSYIVQLCCRVRYDTRCGTIDLPAEWCMVQQELVFITFYTAYQAVPQGRQDVADPRWPRGTLLQLVHA